MKLNDLSHKNPAKTALKESFSVDFDPSKLTLSKTKEMMGKVKGLIREAKASPDFYRNQASPSYMKLIFMEQALRDHYAQIPKTTKIVVENEEVAKSQAILAAQDMVDTVQKMYEDINDMMVKELPALVSSIQSDIGVNESSEFNSKATEALSALNTALQTAKTELTNALGSVTGEGPVDFDSDDGLGDDSLEVDSVDDFDSEVDTDLDADIDLDLDFDEPEDVGPVGRAKR